MPFHRRLAWAVMSFTPPLTKLTVMPLASDACTAVPLASILAKLALKTLHQLAYITITAHRQRAPGGGRPLSVEMRAKEKLGNGNY